jgi:hypothetical protein
MSLLPLLLLALPAAAPPVEDAPAAVLMARSLDDVKAAANHLARPVGFPKEVEALNPILALSGLDRTRPAGAFVRWPANKEYPDLNDVVAFAPVGDEKSLLASCRLLGVRVSAAGELHRVEAPGGFTFFLRFARGHVFASRAPEALGSLPSAERLSFPPGETGLLVARGRLDHAWGLEKALERVFREVEALLPSEIPNFDKETRANLINEFRKASAELARGLRQQIREVNLRVEFDRKAEDLSFQLSIVPNQGTLLAGACRHLRGARGRFTRQTGDASLAVQFVLPPSAWEESSLDALLETAAQGAGTYFSPRYQAFLLQFFQALGPTVTRDGLNAAFLAYPDESWLLAVKVQQGRKLDHLVRDLYRSVPTRDRKKVKMRVDHERIGTARVHQVEDGRETALLALRDDLVVTGVVGTPARKQFEGLLLSTVSPDEEDGPFFRLEARGSFFARDERLRKQLGQEAPGVSPASLHARLRLEGGSSLTMKGRLHPQVLAVLRLALLRE